MPQPITDYGKARYASQLTSPDLEQDEYVTQVREYQGMLLDIEKAITDVKKGYQEGFVDVYSKQDQANVELAKLYVDLERIAKQASAAGADVRERGIRTVAEMAKESREKALGDSIDKDKWRVYSDTVKNEVNLAGFTLTGGVDQSGNQVQGMVFSDDPYEVREQFSKLFETALNRAKVDVQAEFLGTGNPNSRFQAAALASEDFAARVMGYAMKTNNPLVIQTAKHYVKQAGDQVFMPMVGAADTEVAMQRIDEERARMEEIDKRAQALGVNTNVSATVARLDKMKERMTQGLDPDALMADIVAMRDKAELDPQVVELRKQQEEVRDRQTDLDEGQKVYDPFDKAAERLDQVLGGNLDKFVSAMGFQGDANIARRRAINYFGQKPETLSKLVDMVESKPDTWQDELQGQGFRTDPVARSLLGRTRFKRPDPSPPVDPSSTMDGADSPEGSPEAPLPSSAALQTSPDDKPRIAPETPTETLEASRVEYLDAAKAQGEKKRKLIAGLSKFGLKKEEVDE